MAVHDKIKTIDYNSVRTKVDSHLGTGSGQSGYGQQLQSSPIPPGVKVSAAGWNNLRNDLINIYIHNDGGYPAISQPAHGDKVRYASSEPVVSYHVHIDNLAANKFRIDTSQLKTMNKGSQTYSVAWEAKLECTITYTFTSSTAARHFFNSGGKARFSSDRSGGTSSDQNQAWTDMLNAIGMIEFGADTDTDYTYYQLTNANQRIFTHSLSGIYSYAGCAFNIYARCNVANNSNGTADTITFLIEWDDPYTGSNDNIDGNMTISTNTIEAAGILVPSGSFTVESPTVSFSGFTAS